MMHAMYSTNMPMPMSNRATRVVPHSSTHTREKNNTHTQHMKAIVNHHRACSRSRSHRNDDICCCRCRFDTCVYVRCCCFFFHFQSSTDSSLSTQHSHTCLFARFRCCYCRRFSLFLFRCCYCSCINGSTCIYWVCLCINRCFGAGISLYIKHTALF